MGNKDLSIKVMRKHMLGDNEFYAGIFIGGMEGVEDEYTMFTQLHPKAKVFPLKQHWRCCQKSFMTNILMAKNLNYVLTWHILHCLKTYLIYK